MRLVSVEDLQLRLDTKGLWVMYFMNCDLKIKCSRDASSCRQGAFYWHTKWRITSKNQQTLNSTSTATWLSRKCIYTSKICAVSFYFVLHESLRCKMKGGCRLWWSVDAELLVPDFTQTGKPGDRLRSQCETGLSKINRLHKWSTTGLFQVESRDSREQKHCRTTQVCPDLSVLI